uniref:Reverse transcriptase domain-containing protein n=1 Tax=Nothobranchius furzeri TaxID=105023 RepID=A0A8C6LQF4_NOTFU
MSFSSFELCLFELCISPRLLVVLIYRPPKTDSNFLNDFCDLVADCILKYDYVLFFGDFNIHICCPDNVLAKGFFNLLESFNLTQWVSSPTHARGHTLDLVISYGLPIMNLVTLPPVFSDHSPILCDVTLPCPVPVCEAPATRFRALDAETISKFVDCMSVRLETFNPDPSNVDHYSQHFDVLCNQVLDVVAPLKLCKSRPRREPWLSDVTRACRRACRSSERKWKKDGLQVSRELFRASLVAYQDAVRAARMAYFADIIETNSNNPKILFKTLNSVLVYQEPSSMSPTAAGNSEAFHKFFVDKVSGIRAVISGNSVDPVPVHPSPPTLSSLNTVSYSELSKLVARQKPSGSPLDVLPPRLWKAAFPCLGPSLGQIINGSLSTGVVPAALKAAVIRPTLKKPGADVSVIENYRPISTLPFTSKLLEKVVYQQLVSHLADSDLFEVFQSGFRSGHSTESALLRVLNDIYLSLDQGTSVLLLLLDLTAAFDTVDHAILLDRLERWVGIKGSALDWFRSYLQNRTFCVKLGDVFSSWEGLRWGVPQGSILGPLLFAIYLLPLGSIFRKHGLSFHLYADDCQIYSPLCQEKGHSIQSFVSCVNEVKSWLMSNYLHLNEGKTELIVFHPNSRNVDRYADLGPLSPYSKPVVTSLGVKLDVGLKFDAHINSVIRSSFFHLRRLAKIKHMLSRAHLERVLHAFVISRLDYCNSLYAGLCQSTLRRLQVVQNSAARFLTGTRKRDHISPVLASLHWLPISYRSQFKILVFVYHFFQGGAPPYLATLLNRHSPSRALRSSDQGLLAVPRSRCRTRGDRAFSVLAPLLWNQLPPSVRLSPSLPVFKNHLKTHLLRLAFPEHV